MSDIVTVLKAGTIVDRAKLNKLKADEMNTVLAAAYTGGATVHIIDNVKTFFDDTALFQALETNSDLLPLILEQRGVTVSEEDMFIVGKYVALVNRLGADLLALIPPPPPYTFADVPEGWTVEANLNLGKVSLRRKKSNSQGDGTGYTVGYKGLQTIWNHASKYWAGQITNRTTPAIRASDYSRTGYVYDNKVEIGCQTVRRYELEQIALHLGWDFPEVKSK